MLVSIDTFSFDWSLHSITSRTAGSKNNLLPLIQTAGAYVGTQNIPYKYTILSHSSIWNPGVALPSSCQSKSKCHSFHILPEVRLSSNDSNSSGKSYLQRLPIHTSFEELTEEVCLAHTLCLNSSKLREDSRYRSKMNYALRMIF